VQSVTGSIQGGSEVIRIDFAQPLTAIPAGLCHPVAGTHCAGLPRSDQCHGRSTVEINQGNLRSVNVVQAGDRTRLVLNLKQRLRPTRRRLQGKSLLVIAGPCGSGASGALQPAAVFAENRNRDTLPLKDLDFRRGADSSGRIVVAIWRTTRLVWISASKVRTWWWNS
jgi:type IV pilus assembly protein PilQ